MIVVALASVLAGAAGALYLEGRVSAA
ncbi:hypothetical protein L6R52_43665, partial [Myxococcota bacterium]|nr:hypothetical protein [Myxococcota bacterium]